MIRRLTQAVVMGVVVLGVAAFAAAQQTPQPVVRLGNFIEVGNDVFMHIIATGEVRYKTVENLDFEKRVRDRAHSRNPDDNTTHDTEFDGAYAQLQLGVEARYQKNLSMTLLFRQQAIFEGNTIDDRANCTNPGGTDVFGRAASTENPGFRAERYWIDYKFAGTPLRMRVGADLWNVDQAALVGDDDPRFALFMEMGDIDLMAAAVIQYESQRIGLENDNDNIYYTFSAGYNLKPHRFQLDVVYFRDRFSGADTGSTTANRTDPLGFTGQKQDSVLIMGSWTGAIGPIRALVQGNLTVGTARGGTAGIPAGTTPGRDYDIFAGAVVAYAEADLGIVRPFAGVIYGTADGDPTDNKLHGFAPASWRDVTQITGVSWFAHLDTSSAFAARDYACPARLGTPVAGSATTAAVVGPTPLRPAVAGAPAATSQNIGVAALGTTGGGAACTHSVTNAFNQLLGNPSHPGINTTYSNPGTLVIPVGLKVFPVKGHEITGWYVYRGMTDTKLLEVAFAPQLGTKSIGKSIYHEVGGYWMWTLNPYFDIRLAGSVAFTGEGWRDVAELADCTAGPGVGSCRGKNAALKGEARFRARF